MWDQVPKCGTEYQFNLIFINTFHRSTARKKFKAKVPKNIHWYFTIIVKELFKHMKFFKSQYNISSIKSTHFQL